MRTGAIGYEDCNLVAVRIPPTKPQEDVKAEPDAHPEGGLAILNRSPTTSVLTATTIIYTIGAGIPAAPGARLALQLIRLLPQIVASTNSQGWIRMIEAAFQNHWRLLVRPLRRCEMQFIQLRAIDLGSRSRMEAEIKDVHISAWLLENWGNWI